MEKRPNKLVDRVIQSNKARARKDISAWRSAMQQAENTENPKRGLLYNLYDELVLDAHLSAEFQKRILAACGTNFSMYNSENEIDLEKTELFKRPWFYQFVELYIKTIGWGFSVLQIEDIIDGEITEISLLKRRHIIPEKGLFIEKQSDDKGVLYREDPKFNQWLLEIGNPEDLGLYNKTAPHILYKRFAHGAWSEFCEIFGMPLRYGKTNVKDTESLNRMEDMMINMGAASYAVVDQEEEIHFVETAKSNGEVYSNLISLCNADISKLVNGAVIGEASKGGSRSKEEVGERTASMIVKADLRNIESYVNFTLIPKLKELGYPLEGCTFRFEETKDLKSLWERTNALLDKYDIDPDFIQNTFNIPVTKKVQSAEKQNLNNSGDFFG